MNPKITYPALSRWWLLLGVSALAIAGLFSLVLVIARTPGLSDMDLFMKLFHQSLVVHVDLSVLVWFLAIACMCWSLMASGQNAYLPQLEKAALISFALGIALLTLSPLESKAEPLMSNYIPVLMGRVFFLGLMLVFCAVMLMVVHVLSARTWQIFNWPMQFCLMLGALIACISAVAFFWSTALIPDVITGRQYYELAFWGGGHVLQFLHVQVLLVAWYMLAVALKPEFSIHKYVFKSIVSVGFVAAVFTPYGYLAYEVSSMDHRQFFTHSMIALNGIAPTLMSLYLLALIWQKRGMRKGNVRAYWASLLCSVSLFLYGGFLGLLIQGQNVVIPAHYHGSIVGVTLGFMGFAYYALPRFGYADVASWRMAYWQPIIYALGQWMHISGLAWSGGYGVLRKTPGGMQNLPADAKIAMGFMGTGGLIAIIGGLLFVVVMYRAVKNSVRKPAE